MTNEKVLRTEGTEQDNTEEIIGKEEDTQTNVNQQDGQGEGVNSEESSQAGNKQSEKVFTQEEVNEIISKRLKRQEGKYADYDELRAKVEEYDNFLKEQERANMTEVERLKADLEEAHEEIRKFKEVAEEYRTKSEVLRIKTDFENKARKAGIKHVDDAYILVEERIRENAKLTKDGKVEGLDSIVKELADEKPFLLEQPKIIGRPMSQNDEVIVDSKEDQLKKAFREAQGGSVEARARYARLKRELGVF